MGQEERLRRLGGILAGLLALSIYAVGAGGGVGAAPALPPPKEPEPAWLRHLEADLDARGARWSLHSQWSLTSLEEGRPAEALWQAREAWELARRFPPEDPRRRTSWSQLVRCARALAEAEAPAQPAAEGAAPTLNRAPTSSRSGPSP